MPPDLGVLVCEAFRERSEQRTNKYPEVGGCRSRAGARSYKAVALQAALLPAQAGSGVGLDHLSVFELALVVVGHAVNSTHG